MKDLIISVVVLLISVFFCFGYLKINNIRNEKSIKEMLPQNFKQLVFGFGMIFVSVLTLLMLVYFYNSFLISIIKRIIICVFLWVFAFVDFRRHIIPNKLLFFLMLIRIVIAICESIVDMKSAKVELFSSLAAAVGIIVLLCIMRLIVKEGIGFGDIKLFAIIGLYFGLRGAFTIIFLSFFVSFVLSIFMLVTKKKNKKDQIAFAPSILIGTILSVVFFGA